VPEECMSLVYVTVARCPKKMVLLDAPAWLSVQGAAPIREASLSCLILVFEKLPYHMLHTSRDKVRPSQSISQSVGACTASENTTTSVPPCACGLADPLTGVQGCAFSPG
jgi:hypothetical protein